MYPAIPLARDIELSNDDFQKITALIYEQCGINLQEGKRELIKARLGKRIREGQFNSFREYYQFVVGDSSGQELVHLLNSVSTNYTSFFREPQHFEFLRTNFLPQLIERKRKGERKLSFWSAGCSSGEEVYSLVITLLENLEMSQSWEIRVLGTDISTKVLKTAESGVYSGERVQTIPQPFLHKYFLRGDNRWKGFVKVKDAVKKYTSFARLNFMEPFSFPEPFDCIFCRNVMIYFDKKTQTTLVNRFYNQLSKDGLLLIGHSESLSSIQHPFQYLKPAIYLKEK